MAARKKATGKTQTARRKAVPAASRGLGAAEGTATPEPPEVEALRSRVAEAEGQTLTAYRDPLGGHWLALAVLPLPAIAPTPFQRDLSDAHVKRLAGVIDQLDRFLDPVIAVAAPEGLAPVRFWTPNGLHRLTALERLGARSVTALISSDPALAFRILALNTEKAHTVKERALEAVRMARGLAAADPNAPESGYALELEEGALVTLGLCYEERARFAGGAYAPALRGSDRLSDSGIGAALEMRSAWAARLLAVDDRVGEIIAGLKERGFDSPYLRNFVVARIRPFRPRGKPGPEMDELLRHLEQKAASFDLGKVRAEQIGKAAGAPEA